jgi:hypothetical protein
MTSQYGEDIAFAMCIACPVPKDVSLFYCHKLKGIEGLEKGNLCLLYEINRRQPGILNLTDFIPYDNSNEAKESLRLRRIENVLKEIQQLTVLLHKIYDSKEE